MKAVGILAVVWIHCMRPGFSGDASWLELRLGELTRFAVPGFLAVSGFLHASAPPGEPAATRRRLTRLLIPYLVASCAAEGFWLVFEGRAFDALRFAEDLALGAAFGPYYYVPLLSAFVLLAPSLSGLDGRRLGWVLAGALAGQWLFSAVFQPQLFWALRNPLYSGAYYVAGWWLAAHDAAATRACVRHRALVVGTAAAILAVALLAKNAAEGRLVAGTALWLAVWCQLVLLLALGAGRRGAPVGISRLSDATYAIYLFHLFFVLPTQRVWPAAAGVFDPLPLGAAWLAGVLGPLALVALGRALLGARSRAWLGA